MRAIEFRIWQAMAGFNGKAAARALGKSEDTITIYRSKGVPHRETHIVRLAAAAILAGIQPWTAPTQDKK